MATDVENIEDVVDPTTIEPTDELEGEMEPVAEEFVEDERPTEPEVVEPQPEPQPEPEPTAALEPAPVEDLFDPEILGIARRFGMAEQEARSHGSVAALEVEVTRRADLLRAGRTTDEAQPKPPEPFKFKTELNPEDYGKEFLDFTGEVRGMATHYDDRFTVQEKRIAELEGHLRATMQESQQRALQAFEVEFDALVDGLPDEFHADDVLGKGPSRDLTHDSKATQSRMNLLREMAGERLKFASRPGGVIPPTGELFRRSLTLLYQERQQQLSRRKLNDRVNKRAAGAIARPSRGKAPGKATEAGAGGEADEFVNSFMRDQGLTPAPGSEQVLQDA